MPQPDRRSPLSTLRVRPPVFVIALAALLGGCLGDDTGSANGNAGGSSSDGTSDCLGDAPAGSVLAFGDVLPDRSEGLAFTPDGRLFVSLATAVYEVFADGSHQAVVTDLDSALGLAYDNGGLLIAGIETERLERLDLAAATTETVATNLGAANFVAVAPWGSALVSDDYTTRISEVTADGTTNVWLSGIESPNGMAFAPGGDALYVARTFNDPGLSRVPVADDGTPGTPVTVATFAAGSSPDGITVAADGAVFVALNTARQIARVAPDGEATIVAEDVPTPASLGFGRGEFDPCSLYATNLFGKQLSRVVLDRPGW